MLILREAMNAVGATKLMLKTGMWRMPVIVKKRRKLETTLPIKMLA
jgi:hypothetical protein